jgi:glutamate-5-semialdehyde dehydrogenase
MTISRLAEQAKRASIKLAAVETEVKNQALERIAQALVNRRNEIVTANKADLKRSESTNLAMPLLKRLKFDEIKIDDAAKGLESLVSLPDPAGVTLDALELDRGLEIYKVSCPIGVIGVIFESRPDALVQISSLCLKSGNAVLLKGGSEASETNRILADIILSASLETGIPDGWLGLMETRDDVSDMLDMDDAIDLIIPRGSNEFVRHIMAHTNIPVLGHADGICHVYVDKSVDLAMAIKIAVDSKCQYVAVCNAAETLLVHRDVADDFLPKLKEALEKKGVELRGCHDTKKRIDCVAADEQDWKTEYLDLILSVKVVRNFDDAVDHINRYGSGHTDVIVTSDRKRAAKFMNYVDSADVFCNCSSRFSDGFRYGLGAEVGISTNKIHARGPVGLEGLVIYKWRLLGDGHIVADYSGKDARQFTHRKLDKDFEDAF